jgi:hypothetical protein
MGQITGEATGVGLLAWLVARGIARGDKRPVRLDIVFGLVTAFLLITHGREILETRDLHRFQSELSSASPADREKVLANSTTNMAALIRKASSLGQEANTKISAIFAELDDPLFGAPLGPETISNTDAINRTQTKANEKAALARTAMQRVDAVLANELQQDKQLADGFSETTARDFIYGVERRHARHRSLYQRQADLMVEGLEELSAALAFVRSRAGAYRIENGNIEFHSTEDVAAYNAHFLKLQDIVVKQGQLNNDLRAEQETATSKLDAIAR